jgi:MOSC domain-containing protein YiiM
MRHDRPVSARVVSVNAGLPRTLAEKPRLVSAIDKIPRPGPVAVGNLGLEGDETADQVRHGGSFRAVYAYAGEDLAHWERELGRPVRPGLIGDNLTTTGLDLNQCVVGEEWMVGTARFAVASVRVPGTRFARWIGLQGVDATDWAARFTSYGRPGVFLTVMGRGYVAAGDPVDVMHVPDHGLTAGTVFRALTTEPALLPLLLEVDGLPPDVYDQAQAHVERTG